MEVWILEDQEALIQKEVSGYLATLDLDLYKFTAERAGGELKFCSGTFLLSTFLWFSSLYTYFTQCLGAGLLINQTKMVKKYNKLKTTSSMVLFSYINTKIVMSSFFRQTTFVNNPLFPAIF